MVFVQAGCILYNEGVCKERKSSKQVLVNTMVCYQIMQLHTQPAHLNRKYIDKDITLDNRVLNTIRIFYVVTVLGIID